MQVHLVRSEVDIGVWSSRGVFTRQPVNVACFEALTKVEPITLPVRSRQQAVRFLAVSCLQIQSRRCVLRFIFCRFDLFNGL